MMNIVVMTTLRMAARNNTRRNRNSSSSTSKRTTVTSTYEKSFDHIEYDVMKSKYSKVVVKTYKTRGGAENFCKKNGMDVACVKSRLVK